MFSRIVPQTETLTSFAFDDWHLAICRVSLPILDANTRKSRRTENFSAALIRVKKLHQGLRDYRIAVDFGLERTAA